jgi:hypothetical protein
MRRLGALLVELIITLPLAGCATPYQPKDGGRFGYSETLLAPDMVEVYFDGNADTLAEHASDFVLLRCAEYSLINGYSHFVFLERITDIETDLVGTPVPQTVYGARYGSYSSSGHAAANVSVQTLDSPHAYARIRMTEVAEEEALDAAFLVQSIKQKYGMF